MSELDIIRLTAEGIGLVIFFGGGFLWLGRRVLKVYEAVSGVNDRLDILNGSTKSNTDRLSIVEASVSFLRGQDAAKAEIIAAAEQAQARIGAAAEQASNLILKEAKEAKEIKEAKERESP